MSTNDKHFFIDLVGCTAFSEQGGFPCLHSIDGIIDNPNNGWAYDGSFNAVQFSAWVIYELAESSVIYSVQLLSGVGRGDHRLLTFKIDMNVDNQWIIPNGLSVQEAPEVTIESDGFIKLDSAITDLTVLFNPVINVASIRLTVTGHSIFHCKKKKKIHTYVP